MLGDIWMIGTLHWDFKGPERLEKFLNNYRPQNIVVEIHQNPALYELLEKFSVSGDPYHKLALKTVFPGIEKANPESYKRFFQILGFEYKIPKKYKLNNITDLVCYDGDVRRVAHAMKSKLKALKEGKNIPTEDFEVNGTDQVQGQELTEEMELRFLYNCLKMATEKTSTPIMGEEFNQYITDLLKKEPSEIQKMMDSEYYEDAIEGIRQFDETLARKLGEERDKPWKEIIEKYDGSTMVVGGLSHFFGKYNNLYELMKDLKPKRHRLIEADAL